MTTRSFRWRRIDNRMREPFRIAGYEFTSMPSVVVEIAADGITGRGEAAGVYFLGDGPDHIEAELERVREAIEQGVDRPGLQSLLPAGGARNAIDCALWEWESRAAGTPIWQYAGLTATAPLVTAFTLPADTPATLLARLAGFPVVRAIKLKLDGDLAADLDRIRTVRAARPDIWLSVDANQGYEADALDALIGPLVDARVAMLEQPVRRGSEATLEGFRSPIPIAGDESILDGAELDAQAARFDVINIKLDKCGGLTEALKMEATCRRLGKQVMVGNMGGSSLAMAPGFVLGQRCDIVDLDGAWFLADDPAAAGLYRDGRIALPADFWGA